MRRWHKPTSDECDGFGLQIMDLKRTADAIANKEAVVLEGLQNCTRNRRNAQANKIMTMLLIQKKLLLLLLCFWPRVVDDNKVARTKTMRLMDVPSAVS